jgi:type I restriction enzyme S subunit
MDSKLPNNWEEGYLYELIEPVKTGVNAYEGERAYYSTGSVKETNVSVEGYYNFEEKPSRANREVKVSDILQARMLDTDKALLITDELQDVLFSTGFIQLRPYNKTFNSKYIYYYLKSTHFHTQKNELASGTTQVAINDANAKKIILPFPSLKEQNRIVIKLDNIYSQLDVIKLQLERIPEFLKNFKQTILSKALAGDLTEKWRVSNNLEKWKSCLLNEICFSITDGDHQAPPRSETGVPFLVISNVSKGFFDFNSVTRFVPRSYFDAIKHTRIPKKGDVLYTVTGSYGIPLFVDFEKDFCFQRHIAILKPDNSKIISKFLFYVLSSFELLEQANNVATGTAQKTVPLRGIKNFSLKLPQIEEQNEIIKQIDSLFKKSDLIEKQYNSLKEKIETLPQSILHKAFKGELVEQLPTDGDARELLKQIKKLKEEVSLKGKKRKK